MAQIIIEVDDNKVDRIVQAVRWYYNDYTLTPAECLVKVDAHLTSKLREFVREYQQREYLDDFVLDDPTV